jgi:hypothetical protein
MYFDIGNPKTRTESRKITVKCRECADEIRTCGLGFSRDSIGSPRSRFGSKVNFERSLKTGRSGA